MLEVDSAVTADALPRPPPAVWTTHDMSRALVSDEIDVSCCAIVHAHLTFLARTFLSPLHLQTRVDVPLPTKAPSRQQPSKLLRS